MLRHACHRVPAIRTRPASGLVMAAVLCLWCGQPFEPRRGGSRQRFCRPGHRMQFHTAARLWAERGIASGALTITDLQNVAKRPCTLLPCRQKLGPAPEIGRADPALSNAPRSLKRLVLVLPISPEGIAELMRLGWITLREGRDPQAVADAVIDLADAALDDRLRPATRPPNAC